jgi:hypothetical protein
MSLRIGTRAVAGWKAQILTDKERKFFRRQSAVPAVKLAEKFDRPTPWNAPDRLRTALAAACSELDLIYSQTMEFKFIVGLFLPEKAV